ncbi:right-handed parallel beta-helix repeat-containing protein [bacterium SCSIO 12741]|nr:right-handed parallel beta-helix repeat-containing protein [bacterium SCSIO 12741]
MNKIFSLTLAFLAFSLTGLAQLSGSYTVGGTGANYATVVEAVDSLNSQGVNGAVTFKIRTGTYTGRIQINAITGSSAINTVTFQPDSANTGAVILQYGALSAANSGTITLSGCDYVTFDSLTVRVTGISYGHAVEFTGATSNITFTECSLEGYNTFISNTVHATVYDHSGAANQATNVTFKDCAIRNGSYGFYIAGSNTVTLQNGWTLENNEITGWYSRGVEALYTLNLKLKDNKIISKNVASTAIYGVYLNYSDRVEIERNQIECYPSSYAYALYLRYCDGSFSDRNLIASNTIYAARAFYGACLYSCNYSDFVFNTVKVDAGLTNLRAGYFYFGSNTTVKNNIFANLATSGHAYYTLGTQTHDYNNIWAPHSPTPNNTTPGANSIAVDPNFHGVTDLHVDFVKLNAAGQTTPGVTTDIDGDIRSTTEPDIGADEFDPDSLDMGIVWLDDIYCTGSQSVTTNLLNLGLDTIKTATIHWLVKRNAGAFVAQTPYSWTGSLASAEETMATLGTYTFQKDSSYQIRAYVSAPNSGVDLNSSNDTLVTRTFQTAMSGTYTIGGITPDFPTVMSAITALQQDGVCGPVTLKLRAGSYNERLLINGISGLSATDSLLITADTGVQQNPLVFTNLSPGVELTGMSHVTIKNIRFRCDNVFGIAMNFVGDNHDIHIDSCEIRTDTTSTSFQCRAVSNRANNVLSRLTISNSVIRGGYFGVNIEGTGATFRDTSFVLQNSEVLDFYYQGINIAYNEGPKVEHCKVSPRINVPYTTYGVYIYYSRFLKFNNNFVSVGASNAQVVYMNLIEGVNGNRCEVFNNWIVMPNHSAPEGDGLQILAGSYMDIAHNNVLFNAGGQASTAMFMNNAATCLLQNNCVAHLGSGTAYEQAGPMQESYNNFHSRSGIDFLSTQTQASTTINVDPGYYSVSDLHVQAIDLNNMGTPITAVPLDYDGQVRSVTAPDIGADEFSPKSIDLRPIGLISPNSGDCGMDSVDVEVLVKNNGTNSITSLPIEVQVIGAHSDTISTTVSRTIQSNKADTVLVGKISTRLGGRFQIKIISNLNNDSLRINDTLEFGNFFINRTPNDPVVGTNIVACSDIDTTLVSTSNGKLTYWYDKPGGNRIHTGDSFRLNISTPDTLWVEASDDYVSNFGMKNISGTTGANYSFMTQGMTFDAVREFTIDSVTVHPFDSGDVIVNLLDASNTKIMSDTFKVGITGEEVLPINFLVPQGYGYKLEATGTTCRGLWRTYSTVNYPYWDADSACVLLGDINGSTFSYYFFYDWYISVDGCNSNLVEVPVGVRPSLNVDIGRDTGYCVGVSINHPLNATTTGAVSYKWQDNSTSPNFSVTRKGTYFVDVAASNGCVTRDSIEIIEVPYPTVTFSPRMVCENAAADSLHGQPRGGMITGTGVVNNRFDPKIAGLGNHLITYRYSNYYGCASTATALVKVDTTVNVSLAPMTAVCQDRRNRMALSGGSPVGPSGYYYGRNVQHSKFLPKDVGTDTIYYVFYGMNGCHDTAWTTVQVKPAPYVTFDSISTLCENQGNFALNVTPAGGTFGGGTVNGTILNPAATGPGLHNITYTVNGTGGCNTTEIRPVLIHPKPNVQLPDQPEACENQTTVGLLSGTPPAGTLFGQYVNSNARSFDVQSSGLGSFPVYYSFTDFRGCTDTASKNVLIKPIPAVNLGGDRSFCGNQTLELDAGNAGANYTWNTGGSSQKITVTKAGRYSVVVDLNGCANQDEVLISYQDICLGIDPSLAQTADITLFPNPSDQQLNIELKGMEGIEAVLTLTGMLGEEITSRTLYEIPSVHQETVDVSALANGIYLLRISTSKGDAVYRVTVQH